MPLSHMEHFLLQTEDIEATKDWYVKILGFRVGPAPDFKFPVYWLYLGDRDVLHITTGGKNVSENRKKYVGQQSEAIDRHRRDRPCRLPHHRPARDDRASHQEQDQLHANARSTTRGCTSFSCSTRTA